MNLNSFVEVSFDDVTYCGVVTKSDENMISFDVPNLGNMNIPKEECVIKELSELNVVDYKIEVEEEKKQKRVVKRSKTGKTKVEMMIELIKEFPDLSRKEYIELGVEREISSKAGCSTFYNSARKLV